MALQIGPEVSRELGELIREGSAPDQTGSALSALEDVRTVCLSPCLERIVLRDTWLTSVAATGTAVVRHLALSFLEAEDFLDD